ncbi:hypothetical protein METBIDRAFT_29868 [Metschnikowia bicuspidata var. bicuspidata NRRL YB-4993]|uniref:P-loop containing nucleoside triphosphate hydrolase protein n=1 Tax=Metschnikowia bicuspidata var. bicuspidata NRRL YB-4993 TaxID=869754 RepID=A0A1A0HGT2_9ASCO|nr:hypothetical protein METBIDRAFT_29868 [Metschnikowia bicuspidata var. bicuspidata NRRL YB-4993]OBA23384.1 hypothetical protein METBIDRAFT_29868 [Metschnikowia bicuspidata var. bicuspidata NRRL YB-4993]
MLTIILQSQEFATSMRHTLRLTFDSSIPTYRLLFVACSDQRCALKVLSRWLCSIVFTPLNNLLSAINFIFSPFKPSVYSKSQQFTDTKRPQNASKLFIPTYVMYTIVDGITTMNSPFDILVIGQRGVGKTTLLRKYVMGARDVPEFELSECLVYKSVERPCHCLNSSSVTSETTINKHISILNSSAGVDTLLTQNSYQVNNAQTMVFAYAAASSESFEALEYTINCIESVRDKLPPCVIVSLKPDLNQMDQVLASQGEALAKSCGALLFVEADLYDDRPVDNVFAPLLEVLFLKDEHQNCLPTNLGNTEALSNDLKDFLVDEVDNLKEDSFVLKRMAEITLKRTSPTSSRSSAAKSENPSEVSVHQQPTEKLNEFRTASLKSLESSFRTSRLSQAPGSKVDKATSSCCNIV